MLRRCITQFARTTPLTLPEINAAIGKVGPKMHFDGKEQYFMAPVEYFFDNATLNGKAKPTADEVGKASESAKLYLADDRAKGGQIASAKAYVHAHQPKDATYTDLQFWTFYPYNGPGAWRFKANILVKKLKSETTLRPFGEHYGDWEVAMVRIDNETKKPIAVQMSQHSWDVQFYKSDKKSWKSLKFNKDVVDIYASKNGHAIYPGKGDNPSLDKKSRTKIKVGPVEMYLCNFTNNNGKKLEFSKNYQIIAVTQNGATSFLVPWATYKGKWGQNQKFGSEAYAEVAKRLMKVIPSWIPGKSAIAKEVGKLLKLIFGSQSGNAPSGPVAKDKWTGKW